MSTIIISGAGRGIGLELSKQYQARGETVIGLCRNATPELESLGIEIIDSVDVTDESSIAKMVEQLNGRSIDMLINNAGILHKVTLDKPDYDSIRNQFEVNALGPLKVTTGLLGNLSPSAKVGVITSRMGSIADNTSGSHYGYRSSKAAANIIGVSLAQDLKPKGIAVAILHPGMVSTDMTRHNGIPVAEAASGLIARLDNLDLTNTGRFWHANGEELPW